MRLASLERVTHVKFKDTPQTRWKECASIGDVYGWAHTNLAKLLLAKALLLKHAFFC